MVQVFVVNPKGGCGKTTIATQLAGFYSVNHKTVLLIDHDEQKSCSDWHSGRPQKYVNIKLTTPKNEPQPSVDAYDIVIHDMPAAQGLLSALRAGPDDKIIIPVLPSPTDIKACLRFVMSLTRSGFIECGADIGFVANRVKVSANYSQVLAEFLDKVDIPLLTTLRDSQNYLKAMNSGKTIFDLPKYQAKKDVSQWLPLLDWVHPLSVEEEVAAV